MLRELDALEDDRAAEPTGVSEGAGICRCVSFSYHCTGNLKRGGNLCQRLIGFCAVVSNNAGGAECAGG